MLRAKQKMVSILVACLTFFAALILGITSLFSVPQTTASAATAYEEATFGEGQFLITTTFDGSTYYLPAATTNSGPIAKVFTDVNSISTDNLWTVTASGSNYYIQNSEGKYLYTTATNNGVRVGDTQNAWKYDASANSFQDTATSRYLGIYNASNWRCYTTVNQSNYKESSTSFKFYKVGSGTACEHTNTTSETTEATCTVAGSITVTCDDCHAVVSTEAIPATGHLNTLEEVTTEATCTVAGEKTITCQDCGNVETEVIPAGHNYVNKVCTVCGEKESNEGNAGLDIFSTTGTLAGGGSSISWEGEFFTVVNQKGGTAIRTTDGDHFRAYADSKTIITVTNGGWIKNVEITCTDSSYANVCKTSATNAGYKAAVNGMVVTITPDGNKDSITITASAQWRLSHVEVYYQKESECAHENTSIETTDPTCTEQGMQRTVCECGFVVSEEPIAALGHNYVDNICSRCGEQDPEMVDYSGYYYISFTHSETVYYADNSQLSNSRYYAKTEAPAAETINTNYVYRLEKTATGIYSLYEFDGDCYQETVTVEKVGGIYRFYATVGGDACQFLLNAGSATKYIKFYKASNAGQSNYAQDITLTPVELSANMNGASLTVKDDVSVNYYVTMPKEFEGAIMQFKVGDAEEVIDVEGIAVGDRYMFTINLAPQLMIENISAVLVYNNVELDKMENYSIQQYAINQLNNADPSDEKLKRLVSDMLHYGAAAQTYIGYKTDNLANDKMVVGEKLLDISSNEPTGTDRTIVNNSEIQQYPAYFTGVNVWFDAVNKIIIKVNKTENVTLSINEGEDVAVTSTTIYTEGILATDFNKTYTFVLKHKGVVMQTLTYSVNAYVYAALADGSGASKEMKDLARALYNYGASAEVYA